MITNREKISIFITNYNKGAFIKECLLSCINQTEKNIEIILCDNISTDKSQLIIRNFLEKIIVKKKKKISELGAVNQIDLIKLAYKSSSGSIICFLDSDDYFFKKKISIIRNLFKKNKNIDVIYDRPLIKLNNKLEKFRLKDKFLKNIWPTIIPTSSISIRRKIFSEYLKLGIFNKYSLLEIDFRINAVSRVLDNNFYILNSNLTVYRKTYGGIMSNIKKFSYKWWDKRLQAHFFMRYIYKIRNKNNFYINVDFILTIIVKFFLIPFHKKS